MPLTPQQLLANTRLEVLIETIVWGNSHFQPRKGLAVASDGNAYTIKNLQYAAALLEATAEHRDVQLDPKTAVKRAVQILPRVLGRMKPAGSRHAGSFRLARHGGSSSPFLSDRELDGEVLAVVAHLERLLPQFSVPKAVAALNTRALTALAKRFVTSAGSSLRAPGRQTTLKRSRGSEEARVLSGLMARIDAGYHWAHELQQLSVEQKPDWWPPEWPCALEDCKDMPCFVRPITGGPPNIRARFFKGDWKGTDGFPPYPVVFVSGLQVQLSSPHASGPGFTPESWWSTRPPRYAPSPGEGNCRLAPPLLTQIEPHLSPELSFNGLATMLRCGAGYSHVRFSLSHPSDDIQIAVDELYAVVNRTKALYGVEKVIIACHSRGGLVARKYIVDRWQREGLIDVAKLITYGTPHLGAELAETAREIVAALPAALLDVTNPVLAAWHVFFQSQLFNLIGQIPGVGQEIEDAILDQIMGAMSAAAERISPQLGAFFEAGQQLGPTSPFIVKLNADYSDPVIPMGERRVSLWQAIDHVLIAGTTPTYLKLYLGSWIPDFRPQFIAASAAQQLIPGICWRTVGFGPLKTKVPFPGFRWNWTWHPILSFIGSLSPFIPELAELPAFIEGEGDSVVEKKSAHADGVVGSIRRTSFALHHFSVKANHEVYGTHETPSGDHVTVNPFQLLFLELGVPYVQTRSCPFAEGECEGFDINEAR